MALSLAINATPTQKSITQVIEAIFGVQPGNIILNSLSDSADATSLTDVANSLVDFVDASSKATPEAFAAVVVANLRITEDSGLSAGEVSVAQDFVVGLLNTAGTANWGSAILGLAQDFSGFTGDATYGAAATAFNSSVISSLDYSLDPDNTDINNGGPATPVFDLTTSQDNLIGTADSDSFIAHIFDNQNTAQSGDKIDGAGGEDSLFADIGTSQAFAITLDTTSVENFAVRTQATDVDAGGENNISAASTSVQIDAQRMVGTNRYESNNSRADLLIEDVRIEDNQITKDITVAMVATDPGDIDFGVYFDQASLRNAADVTSGGVLNLNLMSINDAIDSSGATPLNNNPFDSVSFSVGGVSFTLQLLAIEDVDTYAQLLTTVQAALVVVQAAADVNSPIQGVSAALGGTFIGTQSGTGLTSVGTSIQLTNAGSGEFLEGTWTASKTVPADSEFVQQQSVAAADTSSALITSTIILDDVGRGSNGGDLVVGGLSTGLTSNSKGVEQFDIKVDRDSILGTINSTNNTLREVYIVNEDNTDDSNTTATGGLTVNGNNAGGNELPGDNAQDNAFGFSDVRVIDASTMVGAVNLTAELTTAVVAKYMDSVDTNGDPKADNQITGDFDYTMGTADDSFALTISNANLAAAGTTTREDFTLEIDGGTGNDTLTTIIGNGAGTTATNWYINSTLNANLNVDGGSGDDVITTTGAGNFVINAGSDDDTVYANNDGTGNTAAVNEVQTLTFGAAGDLNTQGQVTVTLSNGQTFTTAALATNDTPATVAAAVVTAFGVAAAANTAALAAANAATAALVAAATAAAGTAGATAADAAVATNAALIVSLTAIAVDYAAITAAQQGADVTLTYNANYSDSPDPSLATISSIATDTVATQADTTASDASTLVAAVAEAVTITTTTAGAAGDTITFNDGSAVLTLVDTDLNGDVSAFEVTQQIAAHTFTLYDVVASNPSIGTVDLVAKAVGVQAALTAVDSGGSNATPAITTLGVAAVAEAGVQTEVQTLTITNGADRAGSVFVDLDIDVDGVIAADGSETFEIAVGLGNEADVALQVAAGINAITGVSAVRGAALPNLDDVIITFDALGNAASAALTDGAIVSSSVVETTKGLAGSNGSATWVVNAVNTEITNLQSDVDTTEAILYKAQLTVTISGAQLAGASGVIGDAAVALSNGFESQVTVPTVGFIATELEVNQAIKDAINNDDILNKILVATDGPANTLVITSLVDGQFDADDLAIDITAATFSSLTTTEQNGIQTAWEGLNNNSNANFSGDTSLAAQASILENAIVGVSGGTQDSVLATTGGTLIAGAASTSVSDNIINLGTGIDLAVLGTDVNSNDTLVFEGNDFGHDTVFNFDDTAGASADTLDFTAYLTNVEDLPGSGSTVSQTRVATSSSVDNASSVDFTSNEVVIVNDFASATNESWSNMTGSDVLAALQSSNASNANNYGNLSNAVINEVANLVGSSQKNILLVENDLNDGEYKVFDVTSTSVGSAGESVSSVSLVGTVDFGDSIVDTVLVA